MLRRFGPGVSLKAVTARESLPGAVLAWLLKNEASGGKSTDWAWRHQVGRYASFSKELSTLPRLSAKDLPFAGAITGKNLDVINWLNSWFLYDQVPLSTATPAARDFDEPASVEQLEAWIMTYLTPEAEEMIEELVRRKLG